MPTITGTNSAETLNGTQFDDIIYGLGGGDTINGLEGNDIIDGGAGGPDKMYGGLGNDTYYVDTWNEKIFIGDNDLVIENDNEGVDRVAASVSYRIGGSIELLEAVNFNEVKNIYLHGSDFNQTIIGNAGQNELLGMGGDDVIIGGAGVDTMWGDGFNVFGNDTFYVDNAGDHVIERVGQGNDKVFTSVSYILEGAAEVEWLQADDSGSTAALDLTGNTFDQTLVGNAGVNILHGGDDNDTLWGLAGNDYLFGDAGADELRGGLGDDTYYVDAGDVVHEAAGEGNDRVAASASFFLTAAPSIELLEPVNAGGTEAINLGGSDTANRINGNAGSNILSGQGGDDTLFGLGGDDFLIGGVVGSTDRDLMFGGTGNDTYYVFSSADVATEAVGEGNDRIATKVSLELSGVSEVERLEAGDSTATDALVLTGSDFANFITGNAGANVLNGRGGSDVLTGLGGADTFAFTTALGPANVDTIDDFTHNLDKIALDDAVFTAIGAPGALGADAFATGAAAADASDRIVYNSATGQLFYDSDGNGAAAAILFAALTPGLALSASDFVVI